MMINSSKLILIFSFIILVFNVNNVCSKNRDANCRKNGFNFYYFFYGYDGKIDSYEEIPGRIKFKSKKDTHKSPYQFEGEGKNEDIYLPFYPNDLNKIVPLDIFVAVDLSSSVIPKEKKVLSSICDIMENIYDNLYLKNDHLNFIGFAETPFIIPNLNGSIDSCRFANTITNFFENKNFRKNTNFKELFKEIYRNGYMTSEENGKILIILSDGIHDPGGDNISNENFEELSQIFLKNIASKNVLTFLFIYHENNKSDKNKLNELEKSWNAILKKSGGKVILIEDINSFEKEILLISKDYIGRSLGDMKIEGNKDNENIILNHNENRKEDNLYFSIKMLANNESELKYSVNDEGNYKYVFRKEHIPNFILYKQEVPVKITWDNILNRDKMFVTFKNHYEKKFSSKIYSLKFNKFDPIKIETLDELPLSFCQLYEDAPTLRIRLNYENITKESSKARLEINIQSDKLDFSIDGRDLKTSSPKENDVYSKRRSFVIEGEGAEKILTLKFPSNKDFDCTNLQFQVFAYKGEGNNKIGERLPLKINGESEKNLKITIQKFQCISDKGKKIVNFFHDCFALNLKDTIVRTSPLFLIIILGLALLHEGMILKKANDNNLTSIPFFIFCCLLLLFELGLIIFLFFVIPFLYLKEKVVLFIYIIISLFVLFLFLHVVCSHNKKDIEDILDAIKICNVNKVKNFPLNKRTLEAASKYIYIPLSFGIIILSIFLTCFPYNFAGLSIISILFSLMLLLCLFMMNLQHNVVTTIFLNILCGLLISLLFS